MKRSYEPLSASRTGKLMMVGLFLTLMLASLPALAQSPYLVKDINPSADTGSSNPTLFTQVGNRTFFVAYVQGEGYQLWKTDGTGSGTSLVTDQYFSYVSSMTASNGKLFFTVSAGSTVASIVSGGTFSAPNDAELWTSDGTAAGTKMLRNVSSSSTTIADVNGTLFFVSDDGSAGNALWKTDGTPEGTVMVKAMPASSYLQPPIIFVVPLQSPTPYSLTAVNGTLFFVTDAGSGSSLWKSDGTEAGTVVVKSGLSPDNLINVNGTLFFSSGNGLWESDGTDTGTMLVAGIGTGSPILREFTNVNGILFFWAADLSNNIVQLWKTDGTAAGTASVADLCANSCDTTTISPYASLYLTNVNGVLFYAFQNGLWKTDGTAAGTVQVASGISPSDLAALNGAIYFAASDEVNGRELWKSDGTPNGTGLVKDICPGPCSGLLPSRLSPLVVPWGITAPGNLSNFVVGRSFSTAYPRALAVSNGKLFFAACEPVNQCEPWTSDGTSGGTSILKNIVLNTSSRIHTAADLNGTLVFPAFDGTVTKLWKSDGMGAGTAYLGDVTMAYVAPFDPSIPLGILSRVPVAVSSNSAIVNGTFFFVGWDAAHGYELWKTDGTDAGTLMVKDINPGSASSLPSSFVNVNGELFFVSDDGVHGNELWKSDGTDAGTVMVKDIDPAGSNPDSTTPPITTYPYNLTNVNGTLFFVADDGSGAAGLWKSDGSEAGTVKVVDFPVPPSVCTGTGCASIYAPTNLTNVNGTLFFTANNGELWMSDGTASGTVSISVQFSGGVYSAPPRVSDLTAVNGTLFFDATASSTFLPFSSASPTVGLWKSDGTANGTVMVKDFSPTQISSPVILSLSLAAPTNLTNVNGTLFFSAIDGANGTALWKSDGTTDGTVMVKDVAATGLTNVKGVLYFAGKDDANGTELWKSDGTEAGTAMVADINPGANGSWPVLLAISHGKLFFTANDGTHGTELWALNVTPTSVTLTSSKSPIIVGSSVTLTATVSSTVPGTLTGTVQFMDGTNLLGTGPVSGGTATLTTSALTAGTHSITAIYGGDTNFANSSSAVLSQVVLATAPDYTLTANPPSATIHAGESATFSITATADPYFDGIITLGCGTLPVGVTCKFNSTTLNPTSASPAATTLTVSTTSQSASLMAPTMPFRQSNGMALFASMAGIGVFGCVLAGQRRKKRMIALAIVAFALAIAMSACGSGGHQNPNATPVGLSTVQVTATATAGTTGGNTTAHQMLITINVQ
jgi:ELWxxDGT repeat protein